MFKTDIEFTKSTLFIDVEGPLNKRNILKLKKKLYYITEEYSIGEIILDIQKGTNIDEGTLYKFLEEYEDLYEINVSINDA